MMYSEFLELSGKTENYISYREYIDEIEPIYTVCELSKAEFIKLLEEAFEKIVYPAIEKAIHNLPLEEKALLIVDSSRIKRKMEKNVDEKARKIAYEYMRLYANL